MPDEICPACKTNLNHSHTIDDPVWLNDPIKTPYGLSGVDYVGANPILIGHIQQLQIYYNNVMLGAGITPPTWLNSKDANRNHIIQLRVCVELLLTNLGLTLTDYFRGDKYGNTYSGEVQEDWTDCERIEGRPELPLGTPIKAIHIEELRRGVMSQILMERWQKHYTLGKINGPGYYMALFSTKGDVCPTVRIPNKGWYVDYYDTYYKTYIDAIIKTEGLILQTGSDQYMSFSCEPMGYMGYYKLADPQPSPFPIYYPKTGRTLYSGSYNFILAGRSDSSQQTHHLYKAYGIWEKFPQLSSRYQISLDFEIEWARNYLAVSLHDTLIYKAIYYPTIQFSFTFMDRNTSPYYGSIHKFATYNLIYSYPYTFAQHGNDPVYGTFEEGLSISLSSYGATVNDRRFITTIPSGLNTVTFDFWNLVSKPLAEEPYNVCEKDIYGNPILDSEGNRIPTMKWLYTTSVVASLPPATKTGGGAIEIVYVPEHESGYIKLNKFDNIGLKPLE